MFNNRVQKTATEAAAKYSECLSARMSAWYAAKNDGLLSFTKEVMEIRRTAKTVAEITAPTKAVEYKTFGRLRVPLFNKIFLDAISEELMTTGRKGYYVVKKAEEEKKERKAKQPAPVEARAQVQAHVARINKIRDGVDRIRKEKEKEKEKQPTPTPAQVEEEKKQEMEREWIRKREMEEMEKERERKEKEKQPTPSPAPKPKAKQPTPSPAPAPKAKQATPTPSPASAPKAQQAAPTPSPKAKAKAKATTRVWNNLTDSSGEI